MVHISVWKIEVGTEVEMALKNIIQIAHYFYRGIYIGAIHQHTSRENGLDAPKSALLYIYL